MFNWLYKIGWRGISLWLMVPSIFIAIVGVSVLFYARKIEDEYLTDISFYFSMSAACLIFFISIANLIRLTIRSSNEEISQDLLFMFNHDERELRLKIIKETNKERKKYLTRQAIELEHLHESILSENLRRRDGTFVTDWREVLLVARKRLFNEYLRLLARNRANLFIGIIMALAGILIPAFYILSGGKLNEGNGFGAFFVSYWPYFTIVATIEIVAIFFLNLYASNERKIERNKSDLTNIELRLTAGLMLYEKVNKDNFAILADNLSKEDSKFILGKNETTGGVSANKLLETLLKIAPKGGG